MIEFVTVLFVLLGATFMALASLGMVRMPDLFMRMSAATKAATLGAGLILTGAAIHFGDTGVTSRAVAVIVFLILTSPVAAHVIGRAAYFSGVPLWEKTIVDEFRGKQGGHIEKDSQKKRTVKAKRKPKQARKRL